jgi:hypothetical protein
LSGLLNAKEYDGMVIQKECKTPQFQKRCHTEIYMQQGEEEDQK